MPGAAPKEAGAAPSVTDLTPAEGFLAVAAAIERMFRDLDIPDRLRTVYRDAYRGRPLRLLERLGRLRDDRAAGYEGLWAVLGLMAGVYGLVGVVVIVVVAAATR